MTKSLGKSVGIPIVETTLNVSINEYNYGALISEKTLPTNFTPQSNHYAANTIWFRGEITKLGSKLCKIDTIYQLGDIFT